MATRKRTKKQSLAEFRAWLNGVEELQPAEWAPTAEQWKLIRNKINNIIEPKAGVDEATIQKLLETANRQTNHNTMPPQDGQYNIHPAAQERIANIPPPPPPVGGVPPGQVTKPTPAASAVMPQQPAVDLAAPVTPNLDTSDGNYDSGFA